MSILKYKQVRRILFFPLIFLLLVVASVITRDDTIISSTVMYFFGMFFILPISWARNSSYMASGLGVLLSKFNGNGKFPFTYCRQKSFNHEMNSLDYDNEKYIIYKVGMSRKGIETSKKEKMTFPNTFGKVNYICGKWKMIKVKICGDNYIACIVVSKSFYEFLSKEKIGYKATSVYSSCDPVFTYIDGDNITERKIENNLEHSKIPSYNDAEAVIVFKVRNDPKIISKFVMYMES